MSDFLAVAYTPEVEDPMLNEIMGGSFAISYPAEDVRVVLHPGANKVRRELWERCKTLPAVQERLERRLFEEIELTEEVKGEGASESTSEGEESNQIPIAKVEVKAALRLVHHCRYVPQLELWHDAETRMTVRSAIKRRIAALQEGAEV